MARNHFPPTEKSLIARTIGNRDAADCDLNHHIMAVYAEPLRAYFRGMRSLEVLRLGEADDIVNGFFASRLARRTFLSDWLVHYAPTGMRLRRWLMNGMCLYLQELLKKARRQNQRIKLPDNLIACADDLGNTMDRELAVAMVRAALARAATACRSQNMSLHFDIFVKHRYEGLAYAQFCAGLGVTVERAKTMARTAEHKLLCALREVIARDAGGQLTRAEIDSEIAELLDAIGVRLRVREGRGRRSS